MSTENPSRTRSVAQQLRRYVSWSAIGGGVVAGAVLMGWAADITALKSVMPGLTSMKVNTAAALLLAFAALWCRSAEEPSSYRRRAGSACAAAVVLVGLATILQDIAGVDFGIDELLGRDDRNDPVPTGPAGRMGVNTALCLALTGVGIAMLLGRWVTGRVIAQYLFALALSTAFAVWLGYLFASVDSEGLWSSAPMALHTASLFVMLSVGALLADTEVGFMARFTAATPGATMVRSIIPASLVIIPLVGLSRLGSQQTAFYGLELGVACFALLNIAALAAITLAAAARADRQWTTRLVADARLIEAAAERYRNLIETSLQGIVVHRDGLPLFANDAALRLLGCASFEELRDGPPLTKYFAVQEQPGDAATRDAPVDGVEIAPLREVLLTPRDLKERWVLRSARRINWTDGPAVQSLMIDVTERHFMEQHLRQAQKMEAVGQLTAGVAHEFNNLLSVIVGSAEMMGDEVVPHSEAADTLHRIIRAAESGARLTESLLSFSRKRPMRLSVLDPGVVLGEICRLARASLPTSVDMTVTIAEPIRSVTSDATLLQSVMLNLIFNARDACAKQCGILVDARDTEIADASVLAARLAPGHYVAIMVRDNGAGMSEEVRARIFEPFFTTKEVGKGTGLGLSVAFGFVQQMGGHIDVQSQPGHGTTVTIYLPAAQVAADVLAPARRRDAARANSKRLAMIVEDEPEVLATIEAMVRKLGLDVVTATDGPAALEVFARKRPIDLLLADVVMARGMTGPDLARALQARQPGLPVIFMSGYSENVTARRCVADRAETVLTKPFQRAELGAAIDAALGTERATAKPAA